MRKVRAATEPSDGGGGGDRGGFFSFSPTRAGADRTTPCSKPAHLSRIIATLLVQAALLSKQQRTSSIRKMLSLCSSLQERVERSCQTARSDPSISGAPYGLTSSQSLREIKELGALAERNHRNIGDLKAEVRLLDGTRHVGAKLALEESRDAVLAELLAHVEQRPLQKAFVFALLDGELPCLL